ncbi:pre-peptidase C-terminal domain-containing protein [Aurantiacibacter sediminis]|uniref:Pre-peptidase C-terminal domain-containing protein n=1 Tax=Aurantiacibacter sediminis TaxID=2793064 RepID=A0ABS0N213_9SPHN|nr:pre-peptidase C-terminal domain-containing protein [Aurantiacibacter sediminis]MBH5321777.1 pre-peptidase C-terminal domain-containing protein [Aurantiacibacter sediminis]
MTKAGYLSAAAMAAVLMLAPAAAQTFSPTADTGLSASKQDRKPDSSNRAMRSSGGAIALGEGVSGNLDRGTATYTLEGRAGQRVRIALSSSQFDTVLRMTGPGGFSEENDDAPSGGTLNSEIETVLPADGTYRLVVGAYGNQGSGPFRLAAMDPANPAPGGAAAIAMGQTITGTLRQNDQTSLTGQYVDYYAFTGRAGESVTFDLGAPEVDTVLSVYLPDGRQESNDDYNASESFDSRLSITLPTDGTYHVAASSFSPGETGEYSLTIRPADTSVRTVRPASGNARVFALSVGVADYERISPLNRTDEDATRVTAALRDAGMLAPESVTLVNAQATRENFAEALSSLNAAMGDDDLLLVFFSGHGEKVENMTTERDGSAETIELFDTALFDYELAEMFENIDARTLLVIDACFAGGFDNVVRQRNNRMGIFSSDEDVLSLVATGEKAGGYISHIFRAALEGGADLNGDRAVEAGELSEYMRREFYTMVLEEPLATDAEDFRDTQTPGWQHIIVDRGGDGMPHQQVLMNMGSVTGERVARR